ncbi:MMPL family transporter [Actinoallomurus rhizosphaericola]|uniref:MMPL family transporter n=1 Tax=Actinoallomurus rhizosphaericola TaxID=2952536 RepID=UPI002092362E|nr:MMPL family transporter [Actinoallomurus rhizosphaericola]MCO5998222.1 MMPL family transporter [Actinoallomurus rhizosphaericola]
MEGLSRFVLRHKLAVTLAWLALTVAGVLATSQIGGRLTARNVVPGQPSYEANAAIVKTYGTGGRDPLVPVITLPAGRTVDSPGVRAGIGRAFAAAATAVHGRAVSYADTGDRRLVGRDARTTFGLVYGPAAGQAGVMRGPDLTGRVTAAMRAALPPGATLRVTGMQPLESGGGGSGRGPNVLSETLIGGLGALAVLAFVFGSLLALVPLLIAVCSILTSFLIVYGLTTFTDVSVIVQFIVALIGLGVAIDYSLLLVTRWREEQAAGHRGDDAVRRAMATAGRAIVFSGGAVAIGLVAMVVLPVPFLRSVGYGGIIIPTVSVVAVLTLLPVLLARFGARIDRPRLRRGGAAGRGWSAWARGVVRFRWAAVAVSSAVLAALAVAALGLHLGDPESDALASSGPAYEGRAALVHSGVPTGVLTPIDVLVPRGDPAATAARLSRLPGVAAAVAPDTPSWRRDGTALIAVLPVAEGGSAAGKDTVRRVRAAVPAGTGVTGSAAAGVDFARAVYGAFPLMLTLIALATFVLLARAFRSLLLPLKAVLLNLLSLAAILGAMVLVWQEGYGSKPIWGIAATGSITEFVPVMVFAFLYGLSMDYEVFILARMREEYDRTGSTRTAVVEGIGRTGRLVTSAALILFLAFASLASAPITELKVFATGLGLGVLLDATVIRALLVPALVSLFGRWNWWLPAWAARALRVRPAPLPPAAAPEPVPAGHP